MIKRLFFLPFLVLLTISTKAQEQPPEKPKSTRTCRLVFPEMPGSAPKHVYIYDGKENQKIFLQKMNFSEVISLKAGDITLVFSLNPISDPDNIPDELPKIKIAKEIKHLYIFITTDKENTLIPLRMRMINISDGKFDKGETLWYNLSRHRIQAKLGQSIMNVGPKDSTITKKPMPKSGYYRADFIYQPLGRGDFQKITEQRWWHDQKSRQVGFIVEKGSKLPKIYFFRDFRLEE